jgi:hypothetical protein
VTLSLAVVGWMAMTARGTLLQARPAIDWITHVDALKSDARDHGNPSNHRISKARLA